jgi:thiamine biosynthesis lipoprotein
MSNSLLRSIARVSPFVFLLGQPKFERYEFTEVHMGMPVRMVLYADTDSTARSAARAAFRRIAELDNTFSDYRPQSETSRLSARAGEWVAVSPELFEVLSLSVELSRATKGAFDPTVGPLVQLWRVARQTGRRPLFAEQDSARARVGWHRISLDTARRAARLQPGTSLDFGGIAKGYILGQAKQTLRAAGIGSMLVEAGGDIVVGDPPPRQNGWRIEAPDASPELGRWLLSVSNLAVSTSGRSSQSFKIGGVRYSHIVDPRTGGAMATAGTSRVIGSDPATVDAVATAANLIEPDSLRGIKGIHSVEVSTGLCFYRRFNSWKPLPVDIADSSISRIFAYATYRGGLGSILRPPTRPRSRAKLDSIADSIAHRAIRAIHETGYGDDCIEALRHAGAPPGPGAEGIALAGVAERLIKIHRETPPTDIMTRAEIPSALLEVIGYEHNIEYVRQVAISADGTAAHAMMELVRAATPGAIRILTPDQNRRALAILRELWIAIAPAMDAATRDSVYRTDPTSIERSRGFIASADARSTLWRFALLQGWRK